MVNQKFQELKALWGTNSAECANIIEKMKKNLKSRNDGKSEYVFGYTQPGKVVNIDMCSDGPELFEIDGDMNPLGK